MEQWRRGVRYRFEQSINNGVGKKCTNKSPSCHGVENSLTLSCVRQHCRVRCLLFTSYGLVRSTTCRSASSLQVERLVSRSQFIIPRLSYSYREGRGGALTTVEWSGPFSTGWYLHTTVFRSHTSDLKWEACWRPIPKSTSPAWGSNPQYIDYKSGSFTNWPILTQLQGGELIPGASCSLVLNHDKPRSWCSMLIPACGAPC